MYSIAFPNMFSQTHINLNEDKEATLCNLKLALGSSIKTLFGDPNYGNRLRERVFDQNNEMLKDLIIDDIYNCILEYIPQLYLKRSNIELTQKNSNVVAQIKCINIIEQELNLYEIDLTDFSMNE